MDFSVVIPVLDEAAYLGACLAALDAQSVARERFEILVIDNGSTDGTIEIAESWAGVQLLHQPARDPYLARNVGIDAARGRILAFTDADCSVAPDWLARIEAAVDQGGADIVVGRLGYPDDADFWLQRYADYYDAKTQWLFDTPVPDCLYGHGGNMALRAELFERLGHFPPLPVAGDTEILHRALASPPGASIQYAPEMLVTHLEVKRLAEMLPKLASYGRYSDAVARETRYRPLTLAERLRAMGHCIVRNRYGPVRTLGLAAVLALGLVSFEGSRQRASKLGAQIAAGEAPIR